MALAQCLELIIPAILALKPDWSDAKLKRYAKPICIEAKKRDIDPLIAVSVIWHESGFNVRSRLDNGNESIDHGLMQVNCNPMEQIHMKWRRYWCDPKRRKRLYSLEGNIKAGFKELSVWKSICKKKHGNNHSIARDIEGLEEGCLDCYAVGLVDLSPKVYNSHKYQEHLITVLYSHWWIQHYNWNSKIYGDAVLYVYRTLQLQKSDNYEILRNSYYRKLAKKGRIKRCLQKEDLCLKEYNGYKSRTRSKSKSSRRRGSKS
jgi:hypothetical protein